VLPTMAEHGSQNSGLRSLSVLAFPLNSLSVCVRVAARFMRFGSGFHAVTAI